MNILSIVIALVVAYLVYISFGKSGFFLGYVLNFLYVVIYYFLQGTSQEITLITIAAVFLVIAIVTFAEYVAYQKATSFIGYLINVVLIAICTVVIIKLTKVLFTFLANPEMLWKK